MIDVDGLADRDSEVVTDIDGLADTATDRVTEDVTELVARRVRVTDNDSVIEGVKEPLAKELEVCVGDTDAEGLIVMDAVWEELGVDVIGGDGDKIPTLPEKW